MIRERTIADLEFEQVLSLVRRHSLSEGGKEKISPSAFTSDESVIASRAARIEEIQERIIEGKVSLSPFVSLSSLFETYDSVFDVRLHDISVAGMQYPCLSVYRHFEGAARDE